MNQTVWNDAVIYGQWPDASVLNRDITISLAPHKQSLRWQRVTGPLRGLLNYLSRHPESPDKDGPIYFPGVLKGMRRTAENVVAMHLMGFDIDSGQAFDDADARLRESGFAYVIYTSPSHRLKGVDKFRVLLPLGAPYVVDASEELARRKLAWRARYEYIGALIGLDYDETGSDLNRGFNCPRHRPGAPYAVRISSGDLVTVPDIALPETRPRRANVRLRGESLGTAKPKSKELHTFYRRLIDWRGDRFNVADYIDALGWDIFDGVGTDKIHIRCPNAAEHSDPEAEDRATAAWNPEEADCGRAIIRCQHAHCRHLSTADMLTMLVEQIVCDAPMALTKEHLLW